jgi:hypothetical protein
MGRTYIILHDGYLSLILPLHEIPILLMQQINQVFIVKK